MKNKLTRKLMSWVEITITQPLIYWILLISKKNYRLIAIDLSKKTNSKEPQQISFIGKLKDQNNGFSLLKNQKKLLLNFYKILSTSYKNGNAKDFKSVKQLWK